MSVHLPTVRGRLRTDAGLLLLVAVVVALTTALLALVPPLGERAADDAVAATVRAAGDGAEVVATAPRGYADPRGTDRDPDAAVVVQQDAEFALSTLPRVLRAVLSPGVATVTSTALQLLDQGPGRYLRLAYLAPATGPPVVEWTAGGPPTGSTGGEPWPVQVGLSEAAVDALGLSPGDRLPAQDEQKRAVVVVVSGVYRATDPDDPAWRAVPELLSPVEGVTEGVPRVSAAALVTADSLPDLRVGVPADGLTERVTFTPRPEAFRYAGTPAVTRAVGALQTASGGTAPFSWDSRLTGVLDDARAQVATARGQAAVLLAGLLTVAALLLVLAAQLLVQRRSGSVGAARERGATLAGLATELLVESALVASVGTVLGLAVAWLVAGGPPGLVVAAPVAVVAALAPPLLGARYAATLTDVRRTPANRSARRAAARTLVVRRLVLEGLVLALAAVAVVTLHQRGATADGRVDLTAAGAGAWWALAGALLVLRLVPPAAGLALRVTRRAVGATRFLLAVRLAEAGARALPLLVVTVAVAQLTVGAALAATVRDGQAAGALLAVGGDARLTVSPGTPAGPVVERAAAAPGVRAVAAGRLEDGVRLSASGTATTAGLLAVDPAAYADLLAASPLPDLPDLTRLERPAPDGAVPVLLLGADPGLADDLARDLRLRWQDAEPVALTVVGTGPPTTGGSGPVLVADPTALADRGVGLTADTVWAVGPGAGDALGAEPGSLTTYAGTLAARRDAPLPRALVRLAVAGGLVLAALAAVGVLLGAAVGGVERSVSLARLRALGVDRRRLRRVLTGELGVPAALAAAAGLLLGVSAAHVLAGPLDLARLTGQAGAPVLRVPWWVLVPAAAAPLAALVLARVEAARLRRAALSRVLRGGDRL